MTRLVAVLIAVALVLGGGQAAAVVNGSPDDGAHP